MLRNAQSLRLPEQSNSCLGLCVIDVAEDMCSEGMV